MAANQSVDKYGQDCPECGGGFAKDLANRKFRRHLKKLPKHLPNAQGSQIMCGGTKQSWDKGNKG